MYEIFFATKLTGGEYNEDKGEIAMGIIGSYMSEDYRDLINGQNNPYDAIKFFKAEFQSSMPSRRELYEMSAPTIRYFGQSSENFK